MTLPTNIADHPYDCDCEDCYHELHGQPCGDEYEYDTICPACRGMGFIENWRCSCCSGSGEVDTH